MVVGGIATGRSGWDWMIGSQTMNAEVQRLDPGVATGYRGRIAPSPTGYLHLGHGRTFWIAWMRARTAGGKVVLRNDDLDRDRVRTEFITGFIEDLKWLGLDWDEGPDCGGTHRPYSQSERMPYYAAALSRLREGGHVYPCTCSRREILASLSAPHVGEEEPVYGGHCRLRRLEELKWGTRFSWRFRVPDGEVVEFEDGFAGSVRYEAGRDFGDFVVWRHDGVPAYQLACVVDDAQMRITEVVRGEDLLLSTARQILLYRALGWPVPGFCHCPLVRDPQGQRLAKRHAALSLRELRAVGKGREEIRAMWEQAQKGQCGDGVSA
jgi:glutamyl-queuosine tRNA(Asp) synthetase